MNVSRYSCARLLRPLLSAPPTAGAATREDLICDGVPWTPEPKMTALEDSRDVTAPGLESTYGGTGPLPTTREQIQRAPLGQRVNDDIAIQLEIAVTGACELPQ